jgi:hypothetical protein
MRFAPALAPILAAAALIGAAAPSLAADRSNTAGEAELAKQLGDRVAGAPVSCLPQRELQSSQIIRGTAIVYEVGRKLYVNRPSGAETLGGDDILVTRTYTDQLCRADAVRLIDRGAGFEHGFVILGDFVPYTKVTPKG